MMTQRLFHLIRMHKEGLILLVLCAQGIKVETLKNTLAGRIAVSANRP